MRREYKKPEMRCQIVQLGVFGDYGTTDPDFDVQRIPLSNIGVLPIRMD